jgi:hypothetical protein
VNVLKKRMLQFFACGRLPPQLQAASKPIVDALRADQAKLIEAE